MSKETGLVITGMGLGVLLTLFLEFIMVWGTLGHGIVD